MCGICGMVGDDRPELLTRMASAMIHRGPDDEGIWFDLAAGVGLGHRRLSIIDLTPSGRQPMPNEDGSLQLVFNGEIYNYRELRAGLVSKGHVFRSNTDGEVLVHLFEEEGLDGLLAAVNGMFAFALWDGPKRELHLARDHAGVKPLYYYVCGRKLYFASEIKALLQVPEIPRRLNERAVAEYLTHLWVGGRETMLEGVQKLEPGQVLSWKGTAHLRTWFRLLVEQDHRTSDSDWSYLTRQTLLDVVRRQMVADVPLGAFLSGGLDSSSILAAMHLICPQGTVQCFTAKTDARDLATEGFIDDYPFASAAADHFGAQLHAFDVRPDLTSLLPLIVYHLEEPDADPAAILSYLIAKSARERGMTVLLSGTGGDEVFYGYRSHIALSTLRHLDRIPLHGAERFLRAASFFAPRLLGPQHPWLRRLDKVLAGLDAQGVDRHRALVSWSSLRTRRRLLNPDVLAASVGRDVALLEDYSREVDINSGIGWHSHLLLKSFLAAHNFLYIDKTSMASSVEVRVPFVDLEMLRLAARMPDRVKLRFGRTKRVLRSAMGKDLPESVLNRPKTGFGAPLRAWFARDLGPLFQELLAERVVRERGLFKYDTVRSLWNEHQSGQADHAYLLYALMNLEVWQRTFLDRPGELAPS